MDESTSRELEKNVVACLIKNPNVFTKYSDLEPKHFYSSFERDVFDLFKSEVSNLNGKEFSKASFLLKIKNAKLSNNYNIDSETLLKNAIEFAPSPNELGSLISDILLNYKTREINIVLNTAKDWINKNSSKKNHKSVAKLSDGLSSELLNINNLGQDSDVKNLSDGLASIEDRILNPQPISGFKSSKALYMQGKESEKALGLCRTHWSLLNLTQTTNVFI